MLKRGDVEGYTMQRGKLAARPNLCKKRLRKDYRACRSGRLAASPGETKGPCPFGTSETSRSSRGHKKDKMLASRCGSKQAEEVKGAMQCRGCPKQCKKVNANADECEHQNAVQMVCLR